MIDKYSSKGSRSWTRKEWETVTGRDKGDMTNAICFPGLDSWTEKRN